MTLHIDNQRQVISVTLSTAATGLSDAIDLGGYRVAAVVMTTAWTAASLTFQASADNSTYRNLYSDTGGEATITAAASETLAVYPTLSMLLGAHRYIKLRSGTAGAAVAQTTERTLTLVVAPKRT